MDKNTMYSAINTKVAVMLGKLLKEEDYKKILLLQSPGEIATYLKDNTFYREYFDGLDTSKMHRGEIEMKLKEGLINYMDKIFHYFNGEYRNFFKCFYIKYEIIDLKKVARLIHIDKDFADLKSNLVFAGRYRYIDMDKVLKAKSIAQLIQALEGTIYYPFLKNLVDGNTRESLYRFEMSIDRVYFIMLEENVKHLSSDDKKAFYDIIGSFIDMLNLRWIYRGKRYYNLTDEELFNYTINKGKKFNYRVIKGFCYSKSIEELVEKAMKTPYAFMFRGDTDRDIYMERRMNRYLYFKLKSVKRRFNLDISMVLSYLELIGFEIGDIISMIESARYGMDFDEAKKYLTKAI